MISLMDPCAIITKLPYHCHTEDNVGNLTVKSVVDVINDVVSLWGKDSESAFVLLDDVLFGSGKSSDVVNFTDGLVWNVGNDLSGSGGVHTRHLQVNTDVGVVKVNSLGSTQVTNTFVITDGVSGRGESSHTSESSSRRQEFTTFGGKLSGLSAGCVGGRKGGNSGDKSGKNNGDLHVDDID